LLSRLESLAWKIRYHSIRMTHLAQSSHVGSALSIADLLAVLYGSILRLRPTEPTWPGRDRFILSKGHACVALYAVLAECGFFPTEWLDTFYRNGSRLAGHATHTDPPGVELSTGSLGHGLSVACGMALAAKRDRRPHRVFALLSDGECDSGSTWESVLFAPHHKLDGLVVVVDYNKLQALGTVKDILDLEPLGDKWRSFGWSVREVDGHNITDIYRALSSVPFTAGRPSCLIAHTTKGKGVSFMENQVLWHYRSPQGEEHQAALHEIGAPA
jgi:transketolase